ncbi:hypothetical protein SpCBS45565_g01137 [Spizellomyces sp. 'palustris']|nr:hypothetical protein SpCBS45565_g01137 [Spizellomyces sp. 'palustris']
MGCFRPSTPGSDGDSAAPSMTDLHSVPVGSISTQMSDQNNMSVSELLIMSDAEWAAMVTQQTDDTLVRPHHQNNHPHLAPNWGVSGNMGGAPCSIEALGTATAQLSMDDMHLMRPSAPQVHHVRNRSISMGAHPAQGPPQRLTLTSPYNMVEHFGPPSSMASGLRSPPMNHCPFPAHISGTSMDDSATGMIAVPSPPGTMAAGRRPRANTIPGSWGQPHIHDLGGKEPRHSSGLRTPFSSPTNMTRSPVISKKPAALGINVPKRHEHHAPYTLKSPHSMAARMSNRDMAGFRGKGNSHSPIAISTALHSPVNRSASPKPLIGGLVTSPMCPSPQPSHFASSSPAMSNGASPATMTSPSTGTFPPGAKSSPTLLVPIPPAHPRKDQNQLTQQQQYANHDAALLGTDFDDITVAELKDMLRERGLPSSGKKAILVQRLQDEIKLIGMRKEGKLKPEDDPRHPLYHQVRQMMQLRQLQMFHQSMMGIDLSKPQSLGGLIGHHPMPPTILDDSATKLMSPPPLSSPNSTIMTPNTPPPPTAPAIVSVIRPRSISDSRLTRPNLSLQSPTPYSATTGPTTLSQPSMYPPELPILPDGGEYQPICDAQPMWKVSSNGVMKNPVPFGEGG